MWEAGESEFKDVFEALRRGIWWTPLIPTRSLLCETTLIPRTALGVVH